MNIVYITPVFLLLTSIIILMQVQCYYLSEIVNNLYKSEKEFYEMDRVLSYGVAYYKHNYEKLEENDVKFDVIIFDQTINFKYLDADKNKILARSHNSSCLINKLPGLKFLVSDYKILIYT